MLDIRRREFIALVGGGCLLLTAKVRSITAPLPLSGRADEVIE